MSRRPLLAIVLGLLSLALVAAGCGGGDDRVSKQDYEKQVADVGKSIQTAINGISTGLTASSSPADAAKAFDRLSSSVRSAADRLDDIKPPKDIDQPHERFADGLRKFAVDLEAVAKEARAGKVSAVRRFSSRLATLASVRQIQQASAQIQAKGYSLDRSSGG